MEYVIIINDDNNEVLLRVTNHTGQAEKNHCTLSNTSLLFSTQVHCPIIIKLN